jgi:hypothetical protein
VGAAIVRWQAAGRFCEEPSYEVERALGEHAEIRLYAPRVMAVTRVADRDRDRAVNEGFRRLAGYIFGGNTGAASIAMTVPVTQSGERIAMTAPVTQASASDGGYEVTFTMPSAHTMETPPRPTDTRVELRTTAPERVAVWRYSGVSSADIVAQRGEALRSLRRERGEVRRARLRALRPALHTAVPPQERGLARPRPRLKALFLAPFRAAGKRIVGAPRRVLPVLVTSFLRAVSDHRGYAKQTHGAGAMARSAATR